MHDTLEADTLEEIRLPGLGVFRRRPGAPVLPVDPLAALQEVERLAGEWNMYPPGNCVADDLAPGLALPVSSDLSLGADEFAWERARGVLTADRQRRLCQLAARLLGHFGLMAPGAVRGTKGRKALPPRRKRGRNRDSSGGV